MGQPYNFYNLEASYRKYLTAGNKNLANITIKNYLSDLRHFLGWYLFFLKTSLKYGDNSDFGDDYSYFSILNTEIVSDYKKYLIENKLPEKTVNRRLSTLRSFCSFCITQGWLKNNPGKQIENHKEEKSTQVILNDFKKALEQSENEKEVNKYVDDISEFLSL